MAPEFTVVIPCYNEEMAIRETVEKLRAALPESQHYRLIVVNDGSTDGTADILRDMESREGLQVIHHRTNRGYGAALKTGISQAQGEFVVITDADGTYPNERIPELVAMASDVDMVVGARIAEDVEYPFIRKVPKVFLRAYASWLARENIPDLNSGLRVLRTSVVRKFLRILPDSFSFTTTITLAMHTNGYDVHYEPIGYAARVGRSKIRPIRDTLNFIMLIIRTGTYFAPMRVFFPVSVALFVCFLISASYDVFIHQNLTDKTILLVLFSMNSGMFALLADMIDKRSPR
jgi:glycosyltransferase involved in cell wall biosynthesis